MEGQLNPSLVHPKQLYLSTQLFFVQLKLFRDQGLGRGEMAENDKEPFFHLTIQGAN